MASEKKQKKKAAPKVEKKQAAADTLNAEIRSNVAKIAEIEEAQRANRSWSQRVAEVITRFCGSMAFVWIHIAWFGGWIILNSAIPYFDFDPFPFTFLTLVVSLEAIFLSTFILITQNQETRMTERRNHLDLQINMLTEKEDTKLLELVRAIAQQVGAPYDEREVDALANPIEPRKVVEKIIAAEGEEAEDVKPKK